jgi:ketosteroid isomerase-like protein
MTSEKQRFETEIRNLMDDRVRAVRAKDVEGAMSLIAPEIVAFDVTNPLRYSGSDVVRKRLEQWFSSFDDPIGFEIRDLNIETGGDVAFSHSLTALPPC